MEEESQVSELVTVSPSRERRQENRQLRTSMLAASVCGTCETHWCECQTSSGTCTLDMDIPSSKSFTGGLFWLISSWFFHLPLMGHLFSLMFDFLGGGHSPSLMSHLQDTSCMTWHLVWYVTLKMPNIYIWTISLSLGWTDQLRVFWDCVWLCITNIIKDLLYIQVVRSQTL